MNLFISDTMLIWSTRKFCSQARCDFFLFGGKDQRKLCQMYWNASLMCETAYMFRVCRSFIFGRVKNFFIMPSFKQVY